MLVIEKGTFRATVGYELAFGNGADRESATDENDVGTDVTTILYLERLALIRLILVVAVVV